MTCVTVLIGIHRDRINACVFCRSDDADSYFSAVGNEYFRNCWHNKSLDVLGAFLCRTCEGLDQPPQPFWVRKLIMVKKVPRRLVTLEC